MLPVMGSMIMQAIELALMPVKSFGGCFKIVKGHDPACVSLNQLAPVNPGRQMLERQNRRTTAVGTPMITAFEFNDGVTSSVTRARRIALIVAPQFTSTTPQLFHGWEE